MNKKNKQLQDVSSKLAWAIKKDQRSGLDGTIVSLVFKSPVVQNFLRVLEEQEVQDE